MSCDDKKELKDPEAWRRAVHLGAAPVRVSLITIAYCPAALLARCLFKYVSKQGFRPQEHVIVQGHYPINKKRNNHDIAMIAEAYAKIPGCEVKFLDPGKDLGSAQSQNWALERMRPHEFFINLDPDSNCEVFSWDHYLKTVLKADESCALLSCYSPMVENFVRDRSIPFQKKTITTNGNEYEVGFSEAPIPFNLSMWRYSFIEQIGGIPQMGIWWGEVEGPFHAACSLYGKYHGYLMSLMEDESGKEMQHPIHSEYKDRHMRTVGPEQFVGSFDEYVRWKYPQVASLEL